MAQKLQHRQVKCGHIQISKGRKRETNFSKTYVHMYLPEKKMPSTQAKAMILSAKELSLQKMSVSEI